MRIPVIMFNSLSRTAKPGYYKIQIVFQKVYMLEARLE